MAKMLMSASADSSKVTLDAQLTMIYTSHLMHFQKGLYEGHIITGKYF